MIIGNLQDEDALAFKRMAYDECTMIAVAAAIVAQIAITGLSLDSLNQTHWVAKSCFVMSLTFSLVSVYYAVSQQRILGRLLNAQDVRKWIRGPQDLRVFVDEFENETKCCEPDDYVPGFSDVRDFKKQFRRQCFVPNPFSVITLSAPQMLLSGSLYLLLVALGIYLGQFWTHELDSTERSTDAKNVFIMYIVGLYLSGGMYAILGWIGNDDNRSDTEIVDGYLNEYLASHPDALARWNVDTHWRLRDGVLEPITATENEDIVTTVPAELRETNSV
ncbi:hypothetical protein NHQ30_009545 [Ciborinia camelliae]|nr:hypothetical protein NHQ30_009545 [Ciborinia camelliae]